MDANERRESPALIARWVAVGVLLGVILGLMASLIIREPFDSESGLPVAHGEDGVVQTVFLGGSLTDGAWASTEAATFRQRVAYGLDVPVTVSRGDLHGSSLADALDTSRVPLDSELVVVELGSTDYYVEKTSAQAFAAEYGRLLDSIRQRAPDAALVCLGIWAGSANSTDYDRAISMACVNAGGAFVPLADLYDEPGMRGPAGQPAFGGTSDDFHPNDAGHAAIAARILENLTVVTDD